MDVFPTFMQGIQFFTAHVIFAEILKIQEKLIKIFCGAWEGL